MAENDRERLRFRIRRFLNELSKEYDLISIECELRGRLDDEGGKLEREKELKETEKEEEEVEVSLNSRIGRFRDAIYDEGFEEEKIEEEWRRQISRMREGKELGTSSAEKELQKLTDVKREEKVDLKLCMEGFLNELLKDYKLEEIEKEWEKGETEEDEAVERIKEMIKRKKEEHLKRRRPYLRYSAILRARMFKKPQTYPEVTPEGEIVEVTVEGDDEV